jgi:uncharacterized paraquat-inducible protein A
MKKIATFVLLLTISLVTFDAVAQCPMCKTSIEEARKNGTQVGETLNDGILYLLILPYSIAMVFGFIYWRNQRLKKKAAQL